MATVGHVGMPYEWGKICEAIGVNPFHVRDITISMPGDGAVLISLDIYLTHEMAKAIWPRPDAKDGG